MKATPLLCMKALFFIWLILPSVLQAQSNHTSGCEKKLKSYANWKETPKTEWNLSLQTSNGGSLQYIGAFHSTDPAHIQFTQIKLAWEKQKPTIVFFEGPDRGTALSETETIKQLGESGYVRYLAKLDSVKTQTLEIGPQKQIEDLQASGKFSLEQIKLFFVLREATRLRDRKGLQEEQLKTAIAVLIQKANGMLKGFDHVIPDINALQITYQKYWSAPANWWEAPANWFTPLDAGQETGGHFTNEINRLDSENRNRHMYHILSEAVLRGERVFAVVGRNHVPMQADALKCILPAKTVKNR